MLTESSYDQQPSETGQPNPGPAHPSDWILYRRPYACYCPIGGDGPIQTELYLRSGLSFLVGNDSVYSETLTDGWVIQGGGRILFFEAEMDRAWALDFSVSNMWNHGRAQDIHIPLNIIVPDPFGAPQGVRVQFGEGAVPGVTVRDLNRTFFNIAAGRVWYLNNPTRFDGWKWRVGVDVGGRYGTASAQFHQIRQRTDVIGGTFVGFHTDLEVPCGGNAVFLYGMRTEWSYTWSDILQVSSDVQDINLLFNLGIRF